MTAPEQEPAIPTPLLEDPNNQLGEKAVPEWIPGSVEDQQSKDTELARQQQVARTDRSKPGTGRETNPGGQPSKIDPLGEQPGSADLKEPEPDRSHEQPPPARSEGAAGTNKDEDDQLPCGA